MLVEAMISIINGNVLILLQFNFKIKERLRLLLSFWKFCDVRFSEI
jgi:hypothetical protein